MARTLLAHSHVVVVDAQPTGYRGLIALAEIYDWHVHFLANGRAALQFARSLPAELWMIHVQLDDMSGCDLYEMLREQGVDAPTFIICDQYSTNVERRACGIGVDLYLCKDVGRSIDCEALLKEFLPSTTKRSTRIVDRAAARPP
jgi:DNA-binding response OmpR family regulator